MASSDVSVRHFDWNDAAVVAALQQGKSPADPAPTEDSIEALHRWLRQPGMHPERDCFIASEGKSPTGFAYVITEDLVRRGILMLHMLPGSRAAQALLDQAIAHLRGMQFEVLDIDVLASDVEWRRWLAGAGLAHVRTHWHLRRESSDRVPLELPTGVSLRLAERVDSIALTDVQNAAFTGSWGYCPNVPEEISYRMFDLPAGHPDGVVLVYEGTDEEKKLSGYCWTHQESPGEPGIVGMVGVNPERQGNGLGRVATTAGINHLIEVGATPIDITVDSENTSAVRLYESLGFVMQWMSLWYQLKLG
jgi:ribosomal protein S18 acetylase RimI-like enzyme